MLCSVCKKNTAVIFINKQGPDNKVELEGLCYSCASKKGLNPLDSLAKQANLSDADISNMTNQLENLFLVKNQKKQYKKKLFIVASFQFL